MTKIEIQKIKDEIQNGYYDRKDYPSYALTAWDDRRRFIDYIFKILDEQVEE